MRVSPVDPEESTAPAADAEALLDALAGGTLTPDEFVEQVVAGEADDPELAWEALALLDQHFRRKRIDRETFTSLKARLQRHSLGARGDARPLKHAAVADAGLPAMHAEPPAAAAPELRDASLHRELRAGDLLCGRYRAVEILQQREWLTVVEAVDEPKAGLPGLRQRVALQVLDEGLSQDPLVLQRIGKLQPLSHPAITRVLDVEEDGGALVLVTEFFGGLSLRELLERRAGRRMPVKSALGIVRTLAGALAHAHSRGVAHGDLTAANVLITDLGDARLQGFELRAQSHTVQPAADRMAFARLAYELLAGTAEPVTVLTPLSLSRLRAPPGISRGQWRTLRDTLCGRDGHADTGILAAFGGKAPAPGEPALLLDDSTPPPAPARSHLREWVAAGIVAAILGAGIHFYLRALPGDGQVSPAGIAAITVDTPPATATAATTGTSPPDSNAAPASATPTVAAGGLVPASAAAAGIAGTATFIAGAPPASSGGPAAANAMNAGRDIEAQVLAPAPPPPPRAVPTPPSRASIDLGSTYAWVDTTEPVVRVQVTRQGMLDREVTFRWWTETGTAQVDRDFRAIEPRMGMIPAGAHGTELLVPLMPDPARREPRTFYVKIDEPGPGADLGTRTLMQVAIVPPGYPAARDATAAQNVAVPPG